MTRTMTILALACCLIVGLAAVSIVARDSVPLVQYVPPSPVVQEPVANRNNKTDRLVVALAAPATAVPDGSAGQLPEPLRQAFASDSPIVPMLPNMAAPVGVASSPVWPQSPLQAPKLAAKPPIQKSYSLLSEIQISALKGRLQLSAAQEKFWPPVEAALRSAAKKVHDRRLAGARGPPNLDADDIQQLTAATMPLLGQLREDQKRDVRSLARIIGLEAIASRI